MEAHALLQTSHPSQFYLSALAGSLPSIGMEAYALIQTSHPSQVYLSALAGSLPQIGDGGS